MAQRAPSRDHKLRESIRTAAFLSRLLVAEIARRWDEFCGGWPTALFGVAFMELSQSNGSPRLLYPTGRPSQSGGGIADNLDTGSQPVLRRSQNSGDRRRAGRHGVVRDSVQAQSGVDHRQLWLVRRLCRAWYRAARDLASDRLFPLSRRRAGWGRQRRLLHEAGERTDDESAGAMAFLATCDRPHSDFVFAERFGTQPREAIVKLDALSSGAILSLTPLVGLSKIFGRLAGGWLLNRF